MENDVILSSSKALNKDSRQSANLLSLAYLKASASRNFRRGLE